MASSREYRKNLYSTRIAKGLCPQCGKINDSSNRSMCSACSERRKRNKFKHIDAGNCRECSKKRERLEVTFCNSCLNRSSAFKKIRRNNNLCRTCGQSLPSDWTFKSCDPCLKEVRDRNKEKKRQTFKRYGGVCQCCREAELDFLSLDHVKGDGAAERKLLKFKATGISFYLYLRRKGYPAGYQVLCYNCNFSKGRTEKCSHLTADLQSDELPENRRKVLAHYSKGSFRCECCLEANLSFLSIDHIDRTGASHRKKIKTTQFYSWLIKNNYPVGFRVLCRNCNQGREFRKGKCPHELD